MSKASPVVKPRRRFYLLMREVTKLHCRVTPTGMGGLSLSTDRPVWRFTPSLAHNWREKSHWVPLACAPLEASE